MTPPPAHDTEKGVDRLLEIVARLRGKNGCPWDQEQTLESLKPCLIEESYEVIDAIDTGAREDHREELGDVLLQIVLQSQIREEQGDFTFNDVAHHIADKLISRHPHVFGDVNVSGAPEALRNWETLKAEEKKDKRQSILEGLPRHLPALQKAQRLQSRAARVGFDWRHAEDVSAKIEEELSEVEDALSKKNPAAIKEEIGDLLFAVVNLSRFHDVTAEDALKQANAKFTERFREIEKRIAAQGRKLTDCALEELDAVWEDVKAERP